MCLSVLTPGEGGKPRWKSYPFSDELAAYVEANPNAWYVCSSTVRVQTPLRRRAVDLTALWGAHVGRHRHEVLRAACGALSASRNVRGERTVALPPPAAGDDHGARARPRESVPAGHGRKGGPTLRRISPGRVFRVPGSVNVKPGRGGFRTRVLDWHPERVWDFEALMASLSVEAEVSTRPTMDMVPGGAAATSPPDPVHEWLSARGRLGGARGGVESTCGAPGSTTTRQEATTGPGTALSGRGSNPLERGFKCFHAHCQGPDGPPLPPMGERAGRADVRGGGRSGVLDSGPQSEAGGVEQPGRQGAAAARDAAVPPGAQASRPPEEQAGRPAPRAARDEDERPDHRPRARRRDAPQRHDAPYRVPASATRRSSCWRRPRTTYGASFSTVA